MSSAVIATFPNDPAVLSGQSLMVRTMVDNRGAVPIDAPSATTQSPFTYILRSQKEGGPVYGLSLEMTNRRRSPDRVSTPPRVTEPLPAGGKREFQEDIANFWNEGFEPQKYWLTVRDGEAGPDSPKASVTVLPLNVESMSSFVSEDHLATVVAHRRQDGQVTLLQRESQVLDPREGVFEVRQLLPNGGPVSVAAAIDVVPAGNGRWFAWARDGKLTACNGWGNSVVAITQPVPASGTLLSPGFQVELATAVFGTVSPEGRLDTYVVTPSAQLHKRWSAAIGPTSGKVLWNAQPDGSITVAWEEAGSGRIKRQSFTSEGTPRNPNPQVVTPGRAAAWGMPPSGAPTVWAVLPESQGLVLARVSNAGERSIVRLPGLSGASAWDFYEPGPGVSALAAIADEKIYSTRLENPSWRALRDTPRAQGLHIVSLNGRSMWVEWIEGGFGVRRASVP